jgi:hypothetical protein
MSWNNSDGTMDIRLKGGNVTLQVGEETVVRVVNKSGVDLLETNYQVVRVRNEAEGGAQGQRLAVVLARANTKVNHTGLLGIVTETINSNQEGFVTNFGIVRDIDTTGDLQGETWVDGDVLWLSETTAGALTNIEPTTHPIQIGYVIYAHANNGKIFVYLQEGVDELDELHDVSITSVANNQGLFYDSATSLWKNKSIATALGYTPANAATLISTTAPLSGGGDLSANRTFSISQSGAASDGYLSSTDWNTFNNKQPSGSYVPTSRQLTINGTAYDLSADRVWSVGTVTSVAALTLGTTGTDLSSSVATGTTTPVITLNVPTASAANRGALSAADWSTFNTKVGSVTASSPLASSSGSTPNITIQQSSGSQDGYLSSTDWTTFNSKQAAGNYITSLTGEATASGPGAAAVTLNNASVTGKVLTGVNITGGTVQATDTMLTAFGKLQNQINGLIGSTIYQGTWNAATNTPALASGVGVRGYYYIVSVAGTTNLDGITDWFVGDWAIFDGTAWQQVDNTDAVVSVNGQTGAVSLTTDNISEGSTNLYYLDSRARGALSFTAGSGAYNSTTGVITIPTNTNQLTNGASFITLASLSGTAPIQYNNTTGAISITQSGTASNGFLNSTDWNTFNNKLSTATAAATYVPYTGANANLDMGTGTFGINTGRFLLFTKNGAAGIGNSSYVGFLNATATDGIYAQLNASNNLGFYGLTSSVGSSQVAYISRAGDFGGNSFIKTGGTSSQYLMADGSVSTLTNPVTGTGTINTLAKFTATGSTIGNSLFSDNGTNGSLGGTNYSSGTGVRTFNITAPEYAGIGFWIVTDYVADIFSYKSTGNLILQSDPNNFLSNSNIILSVDGTNIATLNTTRSLFSNEIISGSWISTPNARGLTIRNSGNTAYRTAVQMNAGNVLIFGQDSDITAVTLGVSSANISIASTGNVTFSNDVFARVGTISSRGYSLFEASASRGTFAPYNIVSGSGTDYSVGLFSEGELFLATGGTATKRFTMTAAGVATFTSSVTAEYLQSNGGGQINTTVNPFIFFNGGGGTNAKRFGLSMTNLDSFKIYSINDNGTTRKDNIIVANIDGNVGINTNSPSTYIDGESGMAILQSTNGRAVLSLVGTRVDANEALGRLSFTNTNSTNIGNRRLAHISGYRGTTNNSAYLEFATANDALGTGRMWLSQQGYLGVGIINPTGYIQASVDNANNVQMLLVRNFATSATGNFTGNYTAEIRGASSGNLTHAMLIHLNEENVGRRILDITSTYGTVGSFRSDGTVLIRTATAITGGGALQVNGNVNINGVFQINGVTIGGGGGSGITGSGTTGYIPRYSSSTSIGNSIIYDDGTNAAIGTTAPQGLLTLRATVTNTPSLAFKNESGGPSSAISNFTSAAQTYTVIGTNAYVNNTANIVRFNTSFAGSYIAFDEGTMVFGSGTASENPSAKMFLSPAGLLTVNNTIRTQNYGILRAGSFRGGLYTYDAITGAGTDYGITIFAEGGTGNGNIYFCPNGSVTKVMTINTSSNVLIGTSTDAGYKLYVSGTIYATGDVIAFSDVRIKTNIRPIENVLKRITNSRGVIYDRIDNDDKNNIGFIAQELEEQFPELVSTDNQGNKGVKYQNAVAVLFEAIKEQQKQIDEFKKLIK